MPDFDFSGEFLGPSQLVSESIALNNGNITRATLTIDSASLSGEFSFFLTNNGGSSWEEVASGVQHTFSTTGQDLRYKILGSSGATISVRVAGAADFPITVSYEQ